MNIERIDSGPSHLDRTGDEWWEGEDLEAPVRPTHELNGHTMVYSGEPLLELPPEWYTRSRQAKIQAALQRTLKEVS